MGLCTKSGVLQPLGTSSTSCQMLTPGVEDFLRDFPGGGGGKGGGPQLKPVAGGGPLPPQLGRAGSPAPPGRRALGLSSGYGGGLPTCECRPRGVTTGARGRPQEVPGRGGWGRESGKGLLVGIRAHGGVGSAPWIQENKLKPKSGTNKAPALCPAPRPPLVGAMQVSGVEGALLPPAMVPASLRH